MKKLLLIYRKSSLLQKVLVLFLFIIYSLVIFLNCSLVHIDSDFSNLILEANDIIHGDFFLQDRNLTGITFFTTDLLFFDIGTIFFGISNWSYVFAISLMYLALFFSALLLTRVGNIKFSPVVFFVFLSFSALPCYQSLCHLRAHTGMAVFSLLAIYFICKFETSNKIKFYIFAFIFLSMALVGDMVSLVLFVMPIALISIFDYLRNPTKNFKSDKNLLILILVFAALFSSILLDKIYFLISTANKNSYVGGQNFLTFNEYGEHFCIYLKALFGMFDADFTGQKLVSTKTFFYFIKSIYILLCLTAVFLSLKNYFKKESYDYISVVLSFGFILLSLIFITTSISVGLASARYFGCFPILLGIILYRQILLYEKEKFALPHYRKITKYLSVFLCLLLSLLYLKNTNYKILYDGSTRALVSYNKSYKELADYLVRNNLGYGYSDFWTSAITTVYSKNQTKVRQILINQIAHPYNWFNKNSWYSEKANFIILSESTGNKFNLNNESIINNFPNPIKVEKISSFSIFIYDHDISLDKPIDFSIPYKIKFNGQNCQNCQDFNDYRLVNSGGSSWGPYLKIKSGQYSVLIKGKKLSSAFFDVYHEKGAKHDTFTKNVTDSLVSLNLNLEEDVSDLEFFIRNDSESDIQLESLTIEKVKSITEIN